MMGLQISISGNHSIVGTHAHANLLGWVTMALFSAYTGGVVIMTFSISFMLQGNPAPEPLVAAGSLIAFAGVLLSPFLVFSGESATADPITAAIPDTASSR